MWKDIIFVTRWHCKIHEHRNLNHVERFLHHIFSMFLFDLII